MALLLSDYQSIFKNLGKLIFISQLSPSQSAAYRQAMVGSCEQAITGNPSDFTTLQSVLFPLSAQVNSIATSLDAMPSQVKKAAENYLTKVVGPQLNLSSAATVAQVTAALVLGMTGVSATVAQSGTGGANASGYAMYFYNNWGTSLPQSGSPNIPDAWIEVAIV